jgi:hypothetical protein
MRLLSVAAYVAFLASGAWAMDETKKGDKPSAVRALDVKIEGMAKGRFGAPVVIASPEELAKAIPDEAAVAAIAKAVDFKTERLLYFTWSGSGQDKLTFTTAEGKKGVEVTFTYAPGRTRDVRAHNKLFAIPKDATFKSAP